MSRSEGIDQLALNLLAQMWLQRSTVDDVDWALKKVRHRVLHLDVVVDGPRFEIVQLNCYIHIAIGTLLAASGRAEYGSMANAFGAELGLRFT